MNSTKARNSVRRNIIAASLAMAATITAPSTAFAQLDDMRAWLAHDSGMVGVQLMRVGVDRGKRMLQTAAQAGDAAAQYNLGVAYAKGYFGDVLPDEALNWYRRAADAGYAAAAYNAGVLYANGAFGEREVPHAETWMRLAASLQHAGAQRWLERVAIR